jgi:hypothetical protein
MCLYEKVSRCQTSMIPYPLGSCDRSCVWWLEVPEWKIQLLSDFYQTHPIDSCDRSCVWWFEVPVWKSQPSSDLFDTLRLQWQLYLSCVWWLELPVCRSQLLFNLYDTLPIRQFWLKLCLMIGGACMKSPAVPDLYDTLRLRWQLYLKLFLMIWGACMKKPAFVRPVWYPTVPRRLFFAALQWIAIAQSPK